MPGRALSVADALAAALAERGAASLRFDKRGVSESEDDYLTAGFQAETDDAFAAFRALRGLPGVDTERVAVIGLSVGATIAMRIAAAEKGLAGVVLLAGSHRPGTEVMERQSKRIAESLRRPSQAWIEAAT